MSLMIMCIGISILLTFTIIYGETVQTEYEYQFYNKTITCTNSQDCDIQCIHYNSCRYTHMLCPTHSNCNITIASTTQSQYITITATDSQNVSIHSLNDYGLRNSQIEVTTNSLFIQCDNQYSCASSMFYIRNSTEVTLSCNGPHSCESSTIFAYNTHSLWLNCIGSYSCRYLQLFNEKQVALLPNEVVVQCTWSSSCTSAIIISNADRLSMNCTGSNGCRSSSIYCEQSMDNSCHVACDTSACYDTKVYALEGIFDVNITSQDTNADITLYCGVVYHESCALQRDMSNNQMLCDSTNYCMNYQDDEDNDHNIILWSDFQKYNETITCDDHLNCNIYCVGEDSCAYSTIQCGTSQNCNVHCFGQRSCQYSTISSVRLMDAACSITCDQYSCQYASVEAYNISSLEVHVPNTYGLQFATIEASHVDTVTINCDASSSCKSVMFTAIDTSNININCIGSSSCSTAELNYISSGDYYHDYAVYANFNVDCYGGSSCSESLIASNAGFLNVDCNSDGIKWSGCNTLSLYCPQSSVLVPPSDNTIYCDLLCGKTDSCVNLNVYSINGWNNTAVWSIDDKFPTSATMYCDVAYTSSCSMQGNVNSDEWYCDGHEICSNYGLDLNATHFVTTREYQFYNKSIECEPDEDCFIYCTHAFSCQYSQIHCASRTCALYCDYASSCKYAKIIGTVSMELLIYSTASSALEDAIIYASLNTLYMDCSMTYSCRNQIIHATDTSQLSFDCLGHYSCYGQRILAENVGNIGQRCMGTYSCSTTELYQYADHHSTHSAYLLDCYGSNGCTNGVFHSRIPLQVLCNSDEMYDNGCQSTDFYIGNDANLSIFCGHEQSCLYMKIYSMNGFIQNDITIYSNWDTYAQYSKYYCGYSHHNYCSLIGLIDADLWVCQDTEHCYDYVLDDSDTDFIAIDYDYQHVQQYIVCDQNKSNCEVQCNSYRACWNAHILCPVDTNMNTTCTVFCSASYSCSYLTIYALNGPRDVTLECNNNPGYPAYNCAGIKVLCTPYFNESCMFSNDGNCYGFCSDYGNDSLSSNHVDISFASNDYLYSNSNITTLYAYQYYNHTLHCIGSDGKCTMECKHEYSCQYTSVHFVGHDLQCNVRCRYKSSCSYMEIYGDHCQTLNVTGSSQYSLRLSTIYPGNAGVLHIECLGTYSCDGLQMDHRQDNMTQHIHQYCMQSYSCRNQLFHIDSVSSVSLHCSYGYACRYSEYYIYEATQSNLYCEKGSACNNMVFSTNADTVHIECALTSSCSSSKFYVPPYARIIGHYTYSIQQTSIYTTHGSQSINISVAAGSSFIETTNRIYCTPSFTQYCLLQSYANQTQWDCDADEPCFDFSSNSSQFITQYDYHYYNHTLACSEGTDCYIYCSHPYSCQYAVIDCPMNHGCYLYCGASGCSHSEVNIPNHGSLYLACYGQLACDYLIVTAAERTAYVNIECTTQSNTCQYMQLFVEYVRNISMVCETSSSCRYSEIYHHFTDPRTSMLDLRCDNSYSCGDMIVSTNAYHANIICNKDQTSVRGCNSMHIYYEGIAENGLNVLCNYTQSCYNTNFYVSSGEYGLHMTSINVRQSDNTLHCCESYIYSCDLNITSTASQWECIDRESVCADSANQCPSTRVPHATNILATKESEYYNDTMECADDMDCYVICDAMYSCQYATIQCPMNHGCNILCFSDYACTQSVINGRSASYLSISSTATYSLSDSVIYAPMDANNLELTCSGTYSCRTTIIYASESNISSILCSGPGSCGYIELYAENASYVHWDCTGSSACSYSSVIQHKTASSIVRIQCAWYSSCTYLYGMISAADIIIDCADYPGSCSRMKLYLGASNTNMTCPSSTSCEYTSIYTSHDVQLLNVMRGSTPYDTNNIDLYCGLMYEKSCELISTNDSQRLLCDTCYAHSMDYANTDYIVMDGDYINYKQNITCDPTKTHCTIYCFGSYACQYNSIHCPSKPDSVCTLLGKTHSFANSKIYAIGIDELHFISHGSGAFQYTDVFVDANVFAYDQGRAASYELRYANIYSNVSVIRMNCMASYSCQGTEVLSESMNDMELIYICSGYQACRRLTVDSADSNSNLSVLCSNTYSCEYSTIRMNHESQLNANCNGSSSCQGMKVYGSNDINLNCAGASSCSSVQFMVNQNSTTLTVQCDQNKACRSMKVNAHNVSIAASIDCGAYDACSYLEVYMDTMDDLHINCNDTYSCRSVKLHSLLPISFDTLYCNQDISTSCLSLTSYCAYPDMDTVCTMKYDNVWDFWYCDGDICLYDDDCGDYRGLHLHPNYGSILGGNTVIISGPCYNPNVDYMCKFGTTETDLHLINATHGYCLTPPSAIGKHVMVAVYEDHEWFGMMTTFYYKDLYLDSDVTTNVRNHSNDSNAHVNMAWPFDIHSGLEPPYVDVNIYQIIPYIKESTGRVLNDMKYLSTLAHQVENNGSGLIQFDYNMTGWDWNNNWDIFYPRLSNLSYTFVIAIEAIRMEKTVPIRSRYISKFWSYFPSQNYSSGHRRRLLDSGLQALCDGSTYASVPQDILVTLCDTERNKAIHDEIVRLRPQALRKVAKAKCQKWVEEDKLAHPGPKCMHRGREIEACWWKSDDYVNKIPKCPPTDPLEFSGDPRWTGEWSKDASCNNDNAARREDCETYHPGAHGCVRHANHQQCCYKEDGSICLDINCGGTLDIAPAIGSRWHLWKLPFSYRAHYFADSRPFGWCKEAGMVEEYNDRRPTFQEVDQRDTRTALGLGGGDPHFITLDGFNYTFNPIGDYYYLFHENFNIILRMEPVNNGSVITAFGLRVKDNNATDALNRSEAAIIDTLEVTANATDDRIDIYMNGRRMLWTEDMFGTAINIGDISIYYTSKNVIIRCDFGVFIEIWMRNLENTLYLLEYTVDLDDQYLNQTQGLSGTYDNDASNDLEARNGTIVPSNSSMRTIHYDFGLTWLVDDMNDNIFHSPLNTDIHPMQWIPIFDFDDVNPVLLQKGTEKCGQEFTCLIDWLSTGIDEITNTTLNFVEHVQKVEESIKLIYNISEKVTPSPTLPGCRISEAMNVYFVVDANCNMTEYECNQQLVFISQLLQRIQSTNDDVDQTFGYIEYGNGANEVFALDNGNSMRMLQTIRQRTECNTLHGLMNHPYAALQIALQRFEDIKNGNNNIILLVSGCAATFDTQHMCTLKSEFEAKNVQLLVMKTHNNTDYECLINDIQYDIVNVENTFNTEHMDTIVQSVCLSSSILTTAAPSSSPFSDPPTPFPSMHPFGLVDTTISPTLDPTESRITSTTEAQAITEGKPQEEDDEAGYRYKYFPNWPEIEIVIGIIVVVLAICVLFGCCYIYKIRRKIQYAPMAQSSSHHMNTITPGTPHDGAESEIFTITR
eukprot:428041_1